MRIFSSMAEPEAPTHDPSGHGAGRTIAWIAIVIVGLAIALVVAFFIWMRTASFDRVVQENALPAISERLGREVKAGSIEGSGFFRTAVEVDDLEIAGERPGAPPFATVGTIYIHMRPWRFIFSGGRVVEASVVELRNLHVHLVRFANGKTNIPVPPTRKPTRRLLRVDELRLIDGSLDAVDEGKGTRLEVREIEARGSDEDPLFTLDELTARTMGGSVRANGTFDRTDRAAPKWKGEAFVDGVELAQLPTRSRAVAGTLVANARLSGEGKGAEARKSADGTAHIELRDATWIHFTVGEEIVKELGKVIHSHKLEVVPPEKEAHTSLGEPVADLRIHGGWATLERPMIFRTSLGRMDLSGRIGLDQRLDLAGLVIVAPEFLTSLVGGKVHVTDPLPVRFRIEGTTRDPKVTGIDVEPFGESLPGLLKRLEQEILSPFRKKR